MNNKYLILKHFYKIFNRNFVSQDNTLHNFYFSKGSIKNVYGNGDNFFIKSEKSDISFTDFSEISTS